MRNRPIPLKAADGRVFAYACQHCETTHAGMSGGELKVRRRYSLRSALHCCHCSGCGLYMGRGWSRCETCRAKERAASEVYREQMRPIWEAQRAKQEAALALSLDTDAALRLYSLMSDISEEHYCAGWMSGLEESLWDIIQPGSNPDYGMGDVTPEEIAELTRLSNKCGGWWYFDDESGSTFITLAEWLVKYQESERRRGKSL